MLTIERLEKARGIFEAWTMTVPVVGDHVLVAIELIDKSTPKGPVNDHCKACKGDVMNWTGDDPFANCPWCGQAINWGE